MSQVLGGKLLKHWSAKNNNCLKPKCLIQVNFKNKLQIHLDPFRSPPTKVRVGDCDQRVWNDDDDLVADDVLDAIDSNDANDYQEPPISVEIPWTRSTRRQVCVSRFNLCEIDTSILSRDSSLIWQIFSQRIF